jgi:hypothetical protein
MRVDIDEGHFDLRVDATVNVIEHVLNNIWYYTARTLVIHIALQIMSFNATRGLAVFDYDAFVAEQVVENERLAVHYQRVLVVRLPLGYRSLAILLIYQHIANNADVEFIRHSVFFFCLIFFKLEFI